MVHSYLLYDRELDHKRKTEKLFAVGGSWQFETDRPLCSHRVNFV